MHHVPSGGGLIYVAPPPPRPLVRHLSFLVSVQNRGAINTQPNKLSGKNKTGEAGEAGEGQAEAQQRGLSGRKRQRRHLSRPLRQFLTSEENCILLQRERLPPSS